MPPLIGCYEGAEGSDALDGGVDGEQSFQDAFELVEVKSVCAIRFGVGGIVVDFKEDAVDAGGYGRAGEDGDELGLAARGSTCSRGRLHGVSGVEDDGG